MASVVICLGDLLGQVIQADLTGVANPRQEFFELGRSVISEVKVPLG